MDIIRTFYTLDEEEKKQLLKKYEKRSYVDGNFYIDEDGKRWEIDNDKSHFEIVNHMVVAYHGESKAIKLPREVEGMAWKDNKYKSMFKYIDLARISCWTVQWTECFKADSYLFKTKEGVLFSYDGLEIMQYPSEKSQYEYVIPDGTEIIGRRAFNRSYSLREIVLSDDVKSIRNSAFNYCKNLEIIFIPRNVKSIGNYVFYKCKKLKAINVAKDNKYFKSVDDVLFSYNTQEIIAYPCNKEGELYRIPESVSSIRYNAFNNLSALKIIDISSCTVFPFRLSENFDGCKALTILARKSHYAGVEKLLKNKPDLKIKYYEH